ncbi:DinB family protein [Chitinophaga caeni]|uniref:DinB family protein n=1 Tax=Chitinophaga caeni TaxID=2029983 RepID=A0A291QWN5_9BACT|nr:DinB family protein [Chitinophaga caeni]ATL48347.1 DinB family protein [Chitinophaga caeni]
MKIIYTSLLLAFVTFLCSSKAQAQQKDSLLSQLSVKWQNATGYALKMAELMPEEYYDFKPVPEQMSFKEQMVHIAQNIQWLSNSYLMNGGTVPKLDAENLDKAGVIQVLKDAYASGLKAHQQLQASELDDIVKFFAGPKTKRQILILLHDHQSHHLGQVIVYLRLKGIKPPPYIGW